MHRLLQSSLLSLVALGCALSSTLACGNDEAILGRAAMNAHPERVAPPGIYFYETHRETVALQMAGTGAAIAIDEATIDSASGPADAALIEQSAGAYELRVTARENAGLYSADLVLRSGDATVVVPVIVPIRPPPSCDDNNPCTTDWADGGNCHNEPIASGSACDDGNACTTNDMCNAGACLGEAVTCGDEVSCTDDICDPLSGCQYIENDDNCDDGDPCTEEQCDAEGGCSHIPMPEGSVCAGEGGCDMIGFCIQGQCALTEAPDGFVCDDGNACTAGDQCLAGACVGDAEGVVTPPPVVVEEAAVVANLCVGGFENDGTCFGESVVQPAEVLSVLSKDSVTYTLWRSTYVNENGVSCSPNVQYAMPTIVDFPDSDAPAPPPPPEQPDQGRADIAQTPYCAAAVFVTRTDAGGETVSRDFITAVRGAVDGALWPDEDLHAFANKPGVIDPDPDEDNNGAPREPPGDAPPEVPPGVGFVVASAKSTGPGLWVAQGTLREFSGLFRTLTAFTPPLTDASSRAGAVAVVASPPYMAAVMLEAQVCPDGELTDDGFGCEPRLTSFQWTTLDVTGPPGFFRVPLPWAGACAGVGAHVNNPHVDLSYNDGVPYFMSSHQDFCSGQQRVVFGALTDGFDPDVSVQTAFLLNSLTSAELDGSWLMASGHATCDDDDQFDANLMGGLCGGGAAVIHGPSGFAVGDATDIPGYANVSAAPAFAETSFFYGVGETHTLFEITDTDIQPLTLVSPGFSHVSGEPARSDSSAMVTSMVRPMLTADIDTDGPDMIDGQAGALPPGRALVLQRLSCE